MVACICLPKDEPVSNSNVKGREGGTLEPKFSGMVKLLYL